MVMRSMSVKTAIVLIPSHWINAKSVEPDEQLLKPKPQYRIRRHLSSRRRQVCAEFAIISSQGGELVGDKFAFILGQADGGLVSAEPFVVPGGGDRRRYELASANQSSSQVEREASTSPPDPPLSRAEGATWEEACMSVPNPPSSGKLSERRHTFCRHRPMSR
jgi:hypothetical protein